MIEKIYATVVAFNDCTIQLSIPPLVLSVTVPTSVNAVVGTSIELHTHLHFNQENGYSIFGFSSPLEKMIFQELIECTGVGPRLAITILSALSPESLFTAIAQENVDLLRTVPGIGQKKAEQLLLLLRHGAKKWEPLLSEYTTGSTHTVWSDVEQALVALEYSRSEIIQALKATQKEHGAKSSIQFDQLLRSTLNFLRQQRG